MEKYNIAVQISKNSGLSLEEELKFAEENGIRCADIFFDKFLPSSFTRKEKELINFYKEQKGFAYTIHAPIIDIRNFNRELNEVILFSNTIQAKTFTVHFETLSESCIDKICSIMDPGTLLSIENYIPDKNTVYGQSYLDFLINVRPQFPVHGTFDAGHALINGYRPIEYLKSLLELGVTFSTFHMHNNNGRLDNHLALTDGKIDFKEIIEFIKTLDNEMYFVIEHWNNIEKSIKFLKENLF